jgi:hypothetical protein
MIIMQTLDALKRKKHIEASKLGKVVFEHATPNGESICIQYHPKGVAGTVQRKEKTQVQMLTGCAEQVV